MSSPPSSVLNSTVLLGGPSKRLLATTMNILYLEKGTRSVTMPAGSAAVVYKPLVFFSLLTNRPGT